MVFGVGFYSFTIGNLSTVIAKMDAGTALLKSKLNTLTDFSKRVNLKPEVEQKIKRFIENNNKDVTTLED
jgi:hyperpolarization activated cyclic nucleotide-gated potassium channel 1